jgi:GTP-binding protein
MGEGRSFVMADLPGLIEGAHEGVGLGHEFLRHVERTRLIVHVVDISAADGRDPYEDFLKINEEIKLYNAKLEQRPQVVVANKMDMPESGDNLDMFRQRLAEDGREVTIYPISALTRDGVQELLYKVAEMLDAIPETPEVEEVVQIEERKVYRFEKQDEQDFTIRRENDVFVVESPSIERLIRRTNFSTQDGIQRFARILRNIGIDKELRKLGAVDGQSIRIGELEFEFVEKE